jgi:ribosomal protein L23
MAARQDQGLLATLIVFVILFLFSFVAAYVGWKSYGESQQRVAGLDDDLRGARDAQSNLQAQVESLRQWIGVGQFDNADDVQKTYDEDMQRFGGTFDEASRAYRTILEYVDQEKLTLATQETATKEKLKKALEDLAAVEAAKEAQVVQFQNQMRQAKEDTASERSKFEQDRRHLEQVEQELKENLQKQRTQYEADIARLTTAVQELTDKLTKSDRAKTNLMAQVSKSSDSFEVADGRVSWVSQDGTLWVNLGSADSLRRQITFSVFDADQSDAARATKKGSIEITRVLGDHLSEARITEDDPRNPILSGDQIYSQVWQRGRKLQFALTGVVDVDDDGHSDLQLVRDLVELNGGSVDAYLDEEGKVHGEITVETRYLLLGSPPDGPNQASLIKGWNDMGSDAVTHGVEKITLDKFLSQIGYAPGDQMVQMGQGARSADFPPPAESNQGIFRPRSPLRSSVPTPY